VTERFIQKYMTKSSEGFKQYEEEE